VRRTCTFFQTNISKHMKKHVPVPDSSIPHTLGEADTPFPVARSRTRSAWNALSQRFHSYCHRHVVFSVVAAAAMALIYPAPAANILWVSEASPGGTTTGTFDGPLSGLTDSGFVTLLQNAGHNVNRFNTADAQTTRLTPEELAAINTNDLIIVGRANNSGTWRQPQGSDWNTNVTKPLICMSPYLVRNIADNRLGWFTGDVGPDDTPTPATPASATIPAVDYIFGAVAMNGTNTAQAYDEPVDRNTSYILAAPVVGSVVYATATFAREDTAAITTGYTIVGFPAGTVVGGGSNILSAYRMWFAGGSRESATGPNAIPLYTGRESLTPAGESMFLRAVEIAINSGTASATDPNAPVGVTTNPASTTILQDNPVNFSVSVTGAPPRSVQWQRDVGDGINFTNIPDALSFFANASYSLSNVTLVDDGARFRVVVSNAFNVATSEVAVLAVTPDTAVPVPLSAGSLDGSSIVICFDDLLEEGSVIETSNYSVNSGMGPDVLSATLRADGKSVLLTLNGPIGPTATLDTFYIGDIYGNIAENPSSLVVNNFGLTGIDIGALNPSDSGTNDTCTSTSFQLTAGGLDVGSTADILRYAYQSVDGDFDARVRVLSIVGTPDHLETTAKAILAVRESSANNARAVNVIVTPPAVPYDNSISSSVRSSAGGATNNIGARLVPGGPPDGWMRITRAGDLFTTYGSTNGVDWVEFGNTTVALGASPLVGVGVVSHRNGKVVTATFSDFQITTPSTTIVLTNASFNAGVFSAAFQTVNGVNYTVQYKDDLNTAAWSTLKPVTGDGTLKTFTDSGPLSPTGSRFYQVSVP